ncbi:MAG: heat shock protein DnaJ protein [Streptosporangiaceae bacterium]|nr:heat shock protein DnaJ protein [Streptosporangiaceae bacterium]
MTLSHEFRPLGPWTDPETWPRKSAYIFRAGWHDTLTLLSDEIDYLDAGRVIIQVDVEDSNIRRDGGLRANARVIHPGVVISFDSKYGPLRYATDAYETVGSREGWRANVRAIALALGALRAVDRYGVTKRGEQYTGWTALPAGTGGTLRVFGSADEALRWMRTVAKEEGLDTGQVASKIYRDLARRLHPDSGGSPEMWERLDAAKIMLSAAGILP